MAKTDKRSIKISAAEIPPAWVKTAPDPGIPSLKTPDPGLTSEWQKKLKTPDPGLVPERVEHVLGTERADRLYIDRDVHGRVVGLTINSGPWAIRAQRIVAKEP